MNLNSVKKEKNQPLSVYVRVRPPSKQEIANASLNMIDIRGRELTVKNNITDKYHRSFTFDRVFGPNSKQIDVFNTVAQPAVAEIINGYNCTIFAYGQTGTGKTYTMAGGNEQSVMKGSSWREEKNAGIIPRTLSYLFDELRVQQIEYTVRVSYLELYNEEIFDLLSPADDTTKLKLYDDANKKGSVIVAGLSELSVSTKGEVYKILEAGAEKRRTASTLMNAQSSRSHTIFSLTVHTKESSVEGEDLLKTGKINLVDLAGSENITKSGVTDKRARETSMINTSLLTLGRCIVALTEHRGHVPFRESKLTRLLQDSLGGRTKTSLIATVSPAQCNLEETLSTLDYASRAKNITNKPEMNQRLTKNALIKDYEDQISKLQRDLQATRLGNGVYVATENYEEMIKELNIQRQEISDKISNIRALKDEMDEKERICSELQMKIVEHLEVVEKKTQAIVELETKLDEASSEINTLQIEKEEKEFLVAKHSEHEQVLHVTAIKLLNTAKCSTQDVEKLHTKLDLIADLNRQNKLAYEQHIKEFNSKISQIQGTCACFHRQQNAFQQFLIEYTNDMRAKQNEFNEKHSLLISIYSQFISGLITEETKITRSQNEINSSIDNAKEQSKNKLTENTKFTEDMYTQQLVPTIEDMKEHLEEQALNMKNFIKLFDNLVFDASDSISNKIDELKNDIMAAKKEVYDNLDDAIYTITKILHSIQISLLHEQEVQKKARENASIAMKLLLDNEAMFEERNKLSKMHCMTSTANLSKLTSDLKHCEQNVGLLVKNTLDATDDIIYDLECTDMDAKKIKQTSMEEVTQALSKGCIINTNTETISEKLLSNVQNRYTEQFDTNNVFIDNLKSTVTNTLRDTNNFMQCFQSKIKQQEYSHEMINTATKNYYDQSYNPFETQVNNNKSDCSQFESQFQTELEVCRENYKKHITTHIKEYKPTGYTPIRKKYKYPKSVPPTTSSEALLEDFRKIKLEVPELQSDEHNTEYMQNTEKEIIGEKIEQNASFSSVAEEDETEYIQNIENESPNTEIIGEKHSSDKIEENASSYSSMVPKRKNVLKSYSGGNIPIPKRN